MIIASLALLVSPVQVCTRELPDPPVPVARVGYGLSASDAWVASTDQLRRSIFLWRRTTGAATAFEAELVPASGGRLLGLDVEGDRVATTVEGASFQYGAHVWERGPAGNWLEGPVLPLPVGRVLEPLIFIDGDTVAAATRSGSLSSPRRVAIWDWNAATGSWQFSEELSAPSSGSLRLEGFSEGHLVATDGPSSNKSLRIFERTAATFDLVDSIHVGNYSSGLKIGTGRIAVPRRTSSPSANWVDVFKETPVGWTLEQRIPTKPTISTVRLAFGDGWLAVRADGFQYSAPTPRPLSLFHRAGTSSVWTEMTPAMPEGGVADRSAEWGDWLAIAGDALFATDSLSPANTGRIFEFDLGCVHPLSPLHWVPAQLTLDASPGWPATGERLAMTTGLPFNVGRPYGLRDATVGVQADYALDIRGLPCTSDYTTGICAYGGYSIKDTVSGMSTAPFPVDPSGGFPQLFSGGPGPTISASSMEVSIPWTFSFAASDNLVTEIPPNGQPIDLELVAQSYNCVDLGGIWYPETPHVTGTSCGYEVLPSTVTSVTFEAAVSGEVAVDLPDLAPGLQGLICDGGINDAQLRASLEAVGSTKVSDNALFIGVTGVPPGRAGLLFLAAGAATPPFPALGFGSLCLSTPLVRVPGIMGVADTFGNVTGQLDLASLPPMAQPQPGSTWAIQWVYRDQGSANTSSARTLMFE